MPVISLSYRAVFARHTAGRIILRALGEQRDALETLARECDGDLKDALTELAEYITSGIHDACLDTLMRREVEKTAVDRQERAEELRNRNILSSAEASGR